LGNMEVGQISAATVYIIQILFSMMMLSMMFQSIARANASAARIRELLDTNPTITDGSGVYDAVPGDTIIEFKNVEFTYAGLSGKPVLSNINLSIRRGDRIAIMGSTGSGKTSLVSLLPRFYNRTSGEILINGRPIEDYKLDELRSKISFTLQKAQLFSGSISDNIRYGKEDATDEEVLEAARIAQADEFITGFKDGYNTIIGEKGASLSGGQKQRLSIARAVIRKPEIIIFDDSTSALDLATEAKLSKSLDEALSDCTVIKVAQRVSSVRNFDRIVVLDGGTICAIGNHDELMQSSPVYRDIYISQEKGGAMQ
ncbi:MAG: ABC transporter ATP-binding protein, partial [Oscillospiraceae bacterium]|nr:ABC transporter ATP-binding protein [Oscillospiraceae bacterium]